MIGVVSPWRQSDADRRFNRQLLIALSVVLVLSFVVSLVPLPKEVVVQDEADVRFAEIILPELEPPVEPEIPKPKIKPKPKPPKIEPKIEKEKAVVQAEVPQTVKQAREKAKVSGLLAFQDELQSMRESSDDQTLVDTASLKRGDGQAATIDRAILTRDKGGKKASINTAALSRHTGGVALAGRESTVVDAPEEAASETGAVRLVKRSLDGVRSIEEVRRVFDANKGAIFSIYNRALRQDPNLLGKIVLELIIEPDGSVSACEVLSSELGSAELVQRVMQRVQLFNFGAKNVAVTKISYPVHFLPT